MVELADVVRNRAIAEGHAQWVDDLPDIVRRTMLEDESVSTLARRYDMSFAAVQKHVAVLERADLVTKRRHGREQLVRTNRDTIHRAQQLLDQLESMWRDRLDRLGGLLEDPSLVTPESPAESEYR